MTWAVVQARQASRIHTSLMVPICVLHSGQEAGQNVSKVTAGLAKKGGRKRRSAYRDLFRYVRLPVEPCQL